MLGRNTLLVIGAGAGADISMPMGGELAGLVSKYLDFGKVNWISEEEVDSAALTRAAIAVLAQISGGDVNSYYLAGQQISNGLLGWSSSIDGYLNRHQDQPLVQQCGKLAIAQVILESERRSDLYVDSFARHGLQFRGTASVRQSWFQSLWSILETGIVRSRNLESIFDRLSVITFNYDRTFEHFLWVGLQQAFHLSETEAATVLNKLDIDHVYGQVADLPWQVYSGVGFPFGVTPSALDLPSLLNRIMTFNEEISDTHLLRKLAAKVASAERIIFLGCHFHEQNMKLLRVAATASDHRDVVVYATATGRSSSAIERIREQIASAIASPHGLEMRVETWDCKSIFREFDTTWARM